MDVHLAIYLSILPYILCSFPDANVLQSMLHMYFLFFLFKSTWQQYVVGDNLPGSSNLSAGYVTLKVAVASGTHTKSMEVLLNVHTHYKCLPCVWLDWRIFDSLLSNFWSWCWVELHRLQFRFFFLLNIIDSICQYFCMLIDIHNNTDN